MNIFYKGFLVLLSFMFAVSVSAQEKETYSAKKRIIIQTEAVKLVEQYEQHINEIGKLASTDIEAAKSTAQSLMSLFINRQVYVTNDLDPNNTLSKFYEIETYSNNLILWYKEGIKVKMKYKEAKVTNIMNHQNDVYSIDVLIPKEIKGNYMNKTLNQNTEALVFRIAFTMSGNETPSNYKIAGIRDAASVTIKEDIKVINDLNSEKIDEEQLKGIYSSVNAILNDYINYLTLIADPDEPAEDKIYYKERFMSAFKDKNVLMPNDLEEKPQVQELSASQYLYNFTAAFNRGVQNLAFGLDSAEYSKVIKMDKGKYYTLVYVDKFFTAELDEKTTLRNDNNLTVKVEFDLQENSYTNFKISNIVANKVNYANVTEIEESVVPELEIEELSRKGFIAGAFAGLGMNKIDIGDLRESETVNGGEEWTYKSTALNTTAGVTIAGYISNRIGFQTGATYSRYATTYNLNGEFIDYDSVFSSPIGPGNEYYKTVDADYDSTVILNTVSIPLLLCLHTSKAGKFGVYGKFGVNMEFPVSASYKATGYFWQKATLVEQGKPHSTGDINGTDYVEGGFKREGETDGKLDDYTGTTVNLVGMLGAEYYISYFVSVYAGFYFEYGLDDIQSDKAEYINIHHESVPHKTTSLQKIGFNIGINYKL